MAVSSHVRQSTIMGNLEVQCRQHDLARAAEAAGFRSMMVIDDDLARSGSCNIESPRLSGFRRWSAQATLAPSIASRHHGWPAISAITSI
jgi:hypothetical protein